MAKTTTLDVYGARVHNLKNIEVHIPQKRLIVITGPSGSGKSSLAFDTIYAEGQRRYIETFSAYGRQFLGTFQRPDVDKIDGLSPVISIEQKTISHNPRSTVGTTTEINDFLRLWFAKAAEPYSPFTGEKMVQYSTEQIIEAILKNFDDKLIYILAPLVRSRKGHYRELFASLLKKGFLHVRVDGKIIEITHNLSVERYKTHDIEVVIDRFRVSSDDENVKRLKNSVELALKYGKNVLMILEHNSDKVRYFSKNLMCPTTGIAFDLPAPNTFSFNSPKGYCPVCKGLGYVEKFDLDKLVPDNNLSIYAGALKPFGKITEGFLFNAISTLAKKYNQTIKTPFKDLHPELVEKILYGSEETLSVKSFFDYEQSIQFNGLLEYLAEDDTSYEQKIYNEYVVHTKCPECNGARLNKEALSYRINGKNIAELSQMELTDLYEWLMDVEAHLNHKQKAVSGEILKEIRTRLKFLLDVGVGYLTLDRSTGTLSGGESQRIRLASQIGSQLVNVLYILDEPSIGLHQSDNEKLLNSLKKLRDQGNTIIVVEHDRDTMLNADYIIDIGPGAGEHGGHVVACGTLEQILSSSSLTAQYLSNEKKIPVRLNPREGNGKKIILYGAEGNNLKNITVEFPLGKFICVTGVSGSGKSSLIFDTLLPIIHNHIYGTSYRTLKYEKIEGLENINKIIEVDQSPIGKTTRSNPATYMKIFDEIRDLFAQLPEAQIRGFKPGRFSFNVKGGRCETCKGAGIETIQMRLLPDVYITCRSCNGKRYNSETLAVRYKGKSIADVLEMTVESAISFFENHTSIIRKLQALIDVGLGYLKLGQPSTTLSGGENQRLKLAAELSKIATGKTLYVFDEPTTGMHFEDVAKFLSIINKIVDAGNTVIIIEHNMDVIKNADYIIDLGPEGGKKGGYVVFTGSIAELLNSSTITGVALKQYLEYENKKVSPY